MTCKHLRNMLPREDADELRDADPEPCPVCDRLPHRQRRLLSLHHEVETPAVKKGDTQLVWRE